MEVMTMTTRSLNTKDRFAYCRPLVAVMNVAGPPLRAFCESTEVRSIAEIVQRMTKPVELDVVAEVVEEKEENVLNRYAYAASRSLRV